MSRLARLFLVPFLVGALSVGAAWAGVVAAPAPVTGAEDLPTDEAVQAPAVATRGAKGVKDDAPNPPDNANENAAEALARFAGKIPAGHVLAGAAKVNIAPKPGEGDVWATQGCATAGGDAPSAATHVADFRSPWPENPQCIYMGGYGIGPMNPITAFDEEFGLWVRSVAIGDGTDTLVLTIVDGASYLGDYNKFCDDCGAFELSRDLGAELGIDPSGFMFASSHSHTAPDFIGGWGGVPQWYMEQVTEALRTSVREAVSRMRPATLEAGEVLARQFNAERRDTYRSAESDTLGWFRALDTEGETIATIGAFAAHPVTADESAGIADADFPGVFDKAVEERFGGVGLYFMKGLGNLSPRGDKIQMGQGLANLVPEPGAGVPVEGTDVRTATVKWDQPVTNPGLTALGTPGFFDRPFARQPASLRVGKDSTRPCVSASPVSVNTGVSAAKIGNLAIAGAPGETFSNIANTIEERNPGGVSLPLAQVNDGLGYIIQSFESHTDGRAGLGFVGGETPVTVEYEDAYALDECFGDMVLESTITALGDL